MSAEMDDRFNDGYKAAEAHWRKRWYEANAAHQEAVTEVERLAEDCRFNRWTREQVEAERDALAARLAAVEALLADGPDTWEGCDTRDIGHAFLAESVLDFTADLRAALAAPTDTTKEQ